MHHLCFAGAFPCREIRFILERDFGHYLLQVYCPSMALVFLSWLTFWFRADATVARVILLLMPVLCMSSMWNTLQVCKILLIKNA